MPRHATRPQDSLSSNDSDSYTYKDLDRQIFSVQPSSELVVSNASGLLLHAPKAVNPFMIPGLFRDYVRRNEKSVDALGRPS